MSLSQGALDRFRELDREARAAALKEDAKRKREAKARASAELLAKRKRFEERFNTSSYSALLVDNREYTIVDDMVFSETFKIEKVKWSDDAPSEDVFIYTCHVLFASEAGKTQRVRTQKHSARPGLALYGVPANSMDELAASVGHYAKSAVFDSSAVLALLANHVYPTFVMLERSTYASPF